MVTGKLSAREILDIQMQPNNADAATIRDYLIALLAAVWRDGEEFSGKRPFGDSGWEYDLYEALARAGQVEANWDDDDGVKYFDGPKPGQAEIADRLIADAIQTLREALAAPDAPSRLFGRDAHGDGEVGQVSVIDDCTWPLMQCIGHPA